MMHSASSRHLKRLGLGAAVVIAVLGIVYLRVNAVRTDELVQSLATSDARGFAEAVQRLKSLRQWAAAPLAAKAANIESTSPTSQSSAQKLRLLAGASIVLDSDEYADEIAHGLLSVDSPTALAVISTLADQGRVAAVWKHLERVHEDPSATVEQQLRVSAVIACMPAITDETVPSLPNDVAEQLLQTIANAPATIQDWSTVFRRAGNQILPSLQEHLLDEDLNSNQRTIAARIVSQYQQDDVDELLSLALEVGPEQLDVLVRALAGRHSSSRERLQQIASAPIPIDAQEAAKDKASRQQANAIVLLRVLGDTSRLLPALQHKPDPRLRAFLIEHFQQCPATGEEWMRSLSTESDTGIKQALLLLAGRQAVIDDRDATIKAILQAYTDDADSGVHSAAAWALRQLGCEQQLRSATQELISRGLRPGFKWYVAPNGMTMIVIEAPGVVVLGSPDSEPGRDASDEQQHDFEINWSFAISATEVSQADYVALCSEGSQLKSDAAPLPGCPAHSMLWSEAIRYCRLLSEAHGIPEDEMVVPAGNPIKPGKFADFKTHTGYRLPIDAEWEFVCRAGTATARPFGFAPQLLPRYCCFAKNSAGQTLPVGSLLPNQLGAFDMLGNVAEWCLNSDQKPTEALRPPAYSPFGRYIVRGNEFQSHASVLRTANRRSDAEITRRVANGFRIARTLKPGAIVKPALSDSN